LDYAQKVADIRARCADDLAAMPVAVAGDAYLELTTPAMPEGNDEMPGPFAPISDSVWGTGLEVGYALSALGFCPEMLVAFSNEPGLSSYVEGKFAEGLHHWQERWRKAIRMRAIRLPGHCPRRCTLKSRASVRCIEDVGCASALSWPALLECVNLDQPGILFVCSFLGTQLHLGLGEALQRLAGAGFLVCLNLEGRAFSASPAGGEDFEAEVSALRDNLRRIDVLSAGQPELLELFRDDLRLSSRKERKPELARVALEDFLSQKGVPAPAVLLSRMRGHDIRMWARREPSSEPSIHSCLDTVTNGAPAFNGVLLAAFVAGTLTANSRDPLEMQCQEGLSSASGALSYARDQHDAEEGNEATRPPLESLVRACSAGKTEETE